MRTRPAPAQLKLSTTTVDPHAGWDSETPAKPASAVMPSVRQPRVPDDGLNATIMLPEPAHIGTYWLVSARVEWELRVATEGERTWSL